VHSGKAKAGRIYAHGKAGTGSHLVAGLIGRYSAMPVGQSYGVGFIWFNLDLFQPKRFPVASVSRLAE